jgi:hypothetical protein
MRPCGMSRVQEACGEVVVGVPLVLGKDAVDRTGRYGIT